MMLSSLCRIALVAMGCLGVSLALADAPSIPRLRIEGPHYVDPDGKVVRFWGVNLVALYPTHKQADALAKNLASRQVNLVRPHHLLRPSRDWNPSMTSGALLTYDQNSRAIDPAALDRFDYLNAALKRNGIYLAFSTHFSRTYLPGDVDILITDDADRAAWIAAMTELNGYDWKKAIDLRKMLPVIDERAARLNEEFARNLLTYKNPYTGVTYADEPQVISIEIVNESSSEYAIVCGNKFPAYWQAKLLAKWSDYAAKAGIQPGDLYAPASAEAKAVRAAFLRGLDEAYFDRMKASIRATGSTAPVTFSNLWRGENNLQMHAERADFIEAHMYGDPLVTRSADDWISQVARSAVANKPFFIGELNQGEGEKNIAQQSKHRTMLPLAAAAYGSLHDWSGMVWFAWLHGGESLGDDGWAREEKRDSKLGGMIQDGTQIDHLRTCGMLFRRGIVAPSRAPIILTIDQPLTAGDYHGLMRGKNWIKPGWQNVHGVRKRFGPEPAEQHTPWLEQSPASPIVSDTGQITKDIERQQLTLVAPQAEAFSGPITGRTPGDLKHLLVTGDGFATVIMVSDDGAALPESERIVLSRTGLDASWNDTPAIKVSVRGLKSDGVRRWHLVVTRPRATEASAIEIAEDAGTLHLPAHDWHEAELFLK